MLQLLLYHEIHLIAFNIYYSIENFKYLHSYHGHALSNPEI